MFAFFQPDDLELAGPLPDDPSLAGWWVRMDGVSYRGKAVAPVGWTRDEVCAGVNRLASRLGENPAKGRLYSRTRVDE